MLVIFGLLFFLLVGDGLGNGNGDVGAVGVDNDRAEHGFRNVGYTDELLREVAAALEIVLDVDRLGLVVDRIGELSDSPNVNDDILGIGIDEVGESADNGVRGLLAFRYGKDDNAFVLGLKHLVTSLRTFGPLSRARS